MASRGTQGGNTMKKFAAAMLAGVAMSFSLATVADAKDKTIGVSWSNFQEEH